MTQKSIAVVGSGISGLSAAWLLAKSHRVTLFEADHRLGGHSHTEFLGPARTPVDVGFIVFNGTTYPNLVQLLRTLDVATHDTEMGFSVSMDDGVEYSGASAGHLVGSLRAALSPSHWRMIADILRFYRTAAAQAEHIDDAMSLGEFLARHSFSQSFITRHLVPMASAIWSSHPGQMLDYPAKAFVRFFENHQLLRLGSRDKWRSITGGSRRYVMAAVEASLKRLQTYSSDLYQMHRPDPDTPIEETLGALDDLVTQGKVRYIGNSNFTGWQVADADWIARTEHMNRFVSAQNNYSLLERKVEFEVIPACERFGLGMLPFFPLASGLLTGKYHRGEAPAEGTRLAAWGPRGAAALTDKNFDKLEKLSAWADGHGKSLLELAFAWLLGHGVVSSVIAGATRPEQVKANAEAGSWVLTPAEVEEVGALAA